MLSVRSVEPSSTTIISISFSVWFMTERMHSSTNGSHSNVPITTETLGDGPGAAPPVACMPQVSQKDDGLRFCSRILFPSQMSQSVSKLLAKGPNERPGNARNYQVPIVLPRHSLTGGTALLS